MNTQMIQKFLHTDFSAEIAENHK